MKQIILAAACLLGLSAGALAQNANVVANCGTPPAGYNAGSTKPGTVDTTGRECGSVTGTITPTPPTAVVSIVSTAAESSHVLKSSPGSLLDVYVTTGATAGYLLVYQATAVPGDGAVTPKDCIPVPANSVGGLSVGSGPPETYGTGITAAFSTTGCFTQTLSATAYFHGRVQ